MTISITSIIDFVYCSGQDNRTLKLMLLQYFFSSLICLASDGEDLYHSENSDVSKTSPLAAQLQPPLPLFLMETRQQPLAV